MTTSNGNSDVELSRDETLLDQLERLKEQVESRDHNGFADAGIRNRLEDEVSELGREISRVKERAVEGDGEGFSSFLSHAVRLAVECTELQGERRDGQSINPNQGWLLMSIGRAIELCSGLPQSSVPQTIQNALARECFGDNAHVQMLNESFPTEAGTSHHRRPYGKMTSSASAFFNVPIS